VDGRKNKIENPLLRSGIAIADANNALKSGATERSDGFVTAEKILGLKLRGTDMVVLSACDTGLGEVKAGEGVYGLRRAFTQAGTLSLVMSMWQVPDQETKELMVEFYKNIRSALKLQNTWGKNLFFIFCENLRSKGKPSPSTFFPLPELYY